MELNARELSGMLTGVYSPQVGPNSAPREILDTDGMACRALKKADNAVSKGICIMEDRMDEVGMGAAKKVKAGLNYLEGRVRTLCGSEVKGADRTFFSDRIANVINVAIRGFLFLTKLIAAVPLLAVKGVTHLSANIAEKFSQNRNMVEFTRP